MEKDLLRNISLLKFYYKTNAKISLILMSNSSLEIRGEITDRNFIFGEKFIIIRNNKGSPIKIFIEDIVPGSIIPEGYGGDSNTLPQKPFENKRRDSNSFNEHDTKQKKNIDRIINVPYPPEDLQVIPLPPPKKEGVRYWQ
jgi:hypothetical protein